MKSRLKPLSGILAALLAGCTVGPDYVRPQPILPSHWSETATTNPAAPPETWWKVFNDPVLNRLVVRALAMNLDLRQATARIADARAQSHAVLAAALPSLSAHNSVSRRLNNFATGTGSGGSTPVGGGFGGGNQIIDIFQTGFDAQWELDFFGGVQRSLEAAEATLEAEHDNRRAVAVTLLGEVARNYIEVRSRQRQIAITEANLRAQEDTLGLTRARQQAGLATMLEVAQQESQAAATRSQLPLHMTALKQALHALDLLLGQPPGAVPSWLASDAGHVPSAAPGIVADLPSELLRRRPDIRRGERQLAAATAQIGIATAELYPKVNLSAFLGLQNKTANDFTPIGKSWSMASSITLPIFNWGRINANIESKQAQRDQAFLTYQNMVLAAFRDVEDALVAYAQEQQRRTALAEATEAARLAVKLAEERYERGLTAFLDVLESQRALFQAESNLADSEAKVATGLVAVYKALGGGWQAVEPVAKN